MSQPAPFGAPPSPRSQFDAHFASCVPSWFQPTADQLDRLFVAWQSCRANAVLVELLRPQVERLGQLHEDAMDEWCAVAREMAPENLGVRHGGWAEDLVGEWLSDVIGLADVDIEGIERAIRLRPLGGTTAEVRGADERGPEGAGDDELVVYQLAAS